MTPSGTELAAFQVVAQCLAQLYGRGLRIAEYKDEKNCTKYTWFNIRTSDGLAGCLDYCVLRGPDGERILDVVPRRDGARNSG